MLTQIELPTLLFAIFVHLTDADQDMSPYEVQTLRGLLDNPRWTTSDRLRSAVATLRADYKAVWADYDAGNLNLDFDAIASALDDLLTALPLDEALSLHAGLDEYRRRLVRAGGAAFSLSAASVVSEGRARVRTDFEKLLAGYAANPADRPASQRPVAAIRSHPTRREALKDAAVIDGDPLPSPSPATASGRPWVTAIVPPAATDPWAGNRMRARCVRVVEETPDAKTYVFAPLQPGVLRFTAGQFVTLELPMQDRTLLRSYTISSSPSRPFTLSITVKRLHLGWVSNWLHDNLDVGVELDMLGPSGRFSCVEHPADKLLLISAGSGITPVMSMLRFLADVAAPVDVSFIHNARTPSDIMFEHELLHLSSQLGPQLSLHLVPARLVPGRSWNGITGRMSADLLRTLVPDLQEREAFVCGPAGYMQAVREILATLGHPASRLHEESFGGAPTSPPRPVAPPQTTPKPVGVPEAAKTQTVKPAAPVPVRVVSRETVATEVVFERSGKTASAAAGDTILDLAERAGVPINSSCRAGACGACRIAKLAGSVEMPMQRVLTADEVDAGEILACVAVAQGRVVIDA